MKRRLSLLAQSLCGKRPRHDKDAAGAREWTLERESFGRDSYRGRAHHLMQEAVPALNPALSFLVACYLPDALLVPVNLRRHHIFSDAHDWRDPTNNNCWHPLNSPSGACVAFAQPAALGNIVSNSQGQFRIPVCSVDMAQSNVLMTGPVFSEVELRTRPGIVPNLHLNHGPVSVHLRGNQRGVLYWAQAGTRLIVLYMFAVSHNDIHARLLTNDMTHNTNVRAVMPEDTGDLLVHLAPRDPKGATVVDRMLSFAKRVARRDGDGDDVDDDFVQEQVVRLGMKKFLCADYGLRSWDGSLTGTVETQVPSMVTVALGSCCSQQHSPALASKQSYFQRHGHPSLGCLRLHRPCGCTVVFDE